MVDPWGKRDAEGRTHHLAHHCADVAACFLRLISEPAIEKRLEKAAGYPLGPVTRARLAVLVFLHDIGKLNAGFQTKWRDPAPIGPFGHVREALDLITPNDAAEAVGKALGIGALGSWGDAAIGLFCAALAHHGRPLDPRRAGSGSDPRIWRSVDGYDPIEAATLLGKALRLWLPEAFDGGPDLPATPAFQHYFAGLVAIADQIASRDGHPFVGTFESGYFEVAQRHARQVVSAVGLRATERRRSWLRPAAEAMLGVTALRPLQEAIAAAPVDEPLLILEAETGSGKTEAALLRFRALFEAGAVDALYFAVPTRSAAVQLHRRVNAAARAMFGAAFDAVLAVPGYLTAGTVRGAPLGAYDVRWDDDPDAARRDARWAAETPRRFLAAEVAVGTVDQVMLSALQAKWAHFRASALSRSLLVVDEVHASDPYMRRILEAVLDTHLGLGGHALLMSATLGAASRLRWLKRPVPPPEAAETLPYPALSSRHGDGRPQAIPAPAAGKAVAMTLSTAISDFAAVARCAAEAAAKGARVLVIRNTVDLAVATLLAVEAAAADAPVLRLEGIATLHHGRFAAEDRSRLDTAVEAALRPLQPGPPVIVIGTQTLEQSLDIDADLLITDLCPADVLLQRLGRLHRHSATPRAPAFTDPRCIVLSPEALSPKSGAHARYGLGLTRDGGIYPDIVGLEATRRLITEHPRWEIPRMNRMLVERTTHPAALDALARTLGPEWQAARSTIEGLSSARGVFAGLRTVQRHLTFDDTESETTVAFADVEDEVQTRLGAGRLSVTFPDPPTGPFGWPVTRIDIPVRFLGGTSRADIRPSIETDTTGDILISIDSRLMKYDRLGLREERHA